MDAKKKSKGLGDSHKIIYETNDQYILVNKLGFYKFLRDTPIIRTVKFIQNHHTWKPRYENFEGDNHFGLCAGMKRSHLRRKMSDIAQNITTFPDGLVMICRSLETIPAGIKGKNTGAICIEHVGNFDIDGDVMTDEHKECIVWLNAELLKYFGLTPSTETVIYHTWYASKSCPGTNFFGGNTRINAENHLIPLIKDKM